MKVMLMLLVMAVSGLGVVLAGEYLDRFLPPEM